MDAFLQNLLNYFPLLVHYQYLLFFLGGALEGLNTMVLAGFLGSLGHIKIAPMFAVLVAAYCVNGYLWYAVGYWGGAKPIDYWLRRHKKRREAFERVRKYFERHSGWAIAVTKTTLSFTVITLVLAGFLKYSFRKFSLYNFLGSVGWVAVTFSVGYFFGQGFELFFRYFENFSYLLLFFVAAAALIYFGKRTGRTLFERWLTLASRVRQIGEAVKDGLDEILTSNDEQDTH